MKLLPLFAGLLLPVLANAALEFRVLSWKGDIDDLHYHDGRAEVTIFAQERTLSPAYRHDSAAPIEFYRLRAATGQAPARIVLPTTQPPPSLTRALLVIHRVDEGKIQTHWLDDSAEDNPAGSLRLHNFSSRSLAVKIGDDTRMLNPSTNARIDFSAARRALPVQVAAEVDGEWRRVASASQPVRSSYRLLVLLRDGRPSLEHPVGLVEWIPFYDLPPAPADTVVASR